MDIKMKTSPLLLAVGLGSALVLAGCAGMTDRQQRVTTGAGIGAAGGAAVGAIAGDTGLGLAIGAGAGALGGLIVDNQAKKRDEAYREGYAQGKRSK